MYSFHLLPCKSQDTLVSILRFAYAFHTQPSVSKMHKIRHWILNILLSFSSSLLSAWQHIPILCQIVLLFCFGGVEMSITGYPLPQNSQSSVLRRCENFEPSCREI